MNAPNSQSLTATPAWRALNLHAAEMMRVRIQELFAQDARRHRRFTCEDVGFFLAFSKQRANEQTMMLMHSLARSEGRRVGKECYSTCISICSTLHYKNISFNHTSSSIHTFIYNILKK